MNNVDIIMFRKLFLLLYLTRLSRFTYYFFNLSFKTSKIINKLAV